MFLYAVMAMVVAFMVGTYYGSVRLGLAIYLGLGVVVLALDNIATEIKNNRDGLPK